MLAQTIGTTIPQTPIKVFKPLSWQVGPWRDKSPVVLLTGSAGGGKSHLAMEKINAFCLKYPGAFALLVRKVKASMTSGTALFFEDEVSLSEAESIMSGAVHKQSKSRFEYANGSMAVYIGLEDAKQLNRLRSIGRQGGVDIAFMEEAIEFSERDFNGVKGRMRGRAAPWRQIILATNPDAPTHWINSRLILGGEAAVYYSKAEDNTYNPADYLDTLESLTGVDYQRLAQGKWAQATGIIYGEVWRDGPEDGNVTEAADYEAGAGVIYWGIDDGYSAGSRFANGIDPQTGTFAADAHPRSIGLYQMKANGQLCRFEEVLRVKLVEEDHIAEVEALGYPPPEFVAIDSSAAQLRDRLQVMGYGVLKATHQVEEGIKELRAWMKADKNGFRRLLIHPRCRHFRAEAVSYRRDDKGKPMKEFDHTLDEARYLTWRLRYERL